MTARTVRCRLPCELIHAGRSHRAMGVNLSPTGLFVQTSVSFEEGTELELRVLSGESRAELRTRVHVSQLKKVHPGAQVVVARGMGLRVLAPDAEWDRLASRLGCHGGKGATPASASDPSRDLPHFRVVLRRKEGIRIRTRVVNVACLGAEEARAGVRADVDEGWEIVKVERQSLQAGGETPRPFRVVARREGAEHGWEATFEAPSAQAARERALEELGKGFCIESVEAAPAEAGEEAAPEAPASPAAEEIWYQVQARHQDRSRIRTRVARVRASSPQEAARRVVEELGAEWQAVKVKPI